MQIDEQIVARRPAFLDNRRLDIEKMREALASRDFATIQRIGHNSKGIGAGYGFPEVSRIGAAIEIAAKALNVIEIEESIQQFANCIQAACSDPIDAPG
jgi:HPt (histidine-containing phosphotransfer) domain-containing protein